MVKEMHYQENTLFDLDPKVKGVLAQKVKGVLTQKVKGVKVTQNVAQYP